MGCGGFKRLRIFKKNAPLKVSPARSKTWCSDQPGQQVMHQLGLKPKPDVFALHMQEETKTYLGFWRNQIYKSTYMS
ncbi:hypothetical protein QE357_004793 [Siphonobacter sp. BAB-5404]|nr:hypothetical protein [Siphonobacter sp. SORGH_AS_0500]